MNTLSETLRELMDRQKMTGSKLGEEIGISATSVSQILTGKTKPRQVTLSRMMKRLCQSKADEQRVITAYEGLDDEMSLSPTRRIEPTPEDEVERVTRYMEIKSMSIAFREDVERVLQNAGATYKREFRKEPYICDFLLSLNARRVAIECKYNVNRDWDRAMTTVGILREGLPCDEVFIVIPYENELAIQAGEKIAEVNGRVLSLDTLKLEAMKF